MRFQKLWKCARRIRFFIGRYRTRIFKIIVDIGRIADEVVVVVVVVASEEDFDHTRLPVVVVVVAAGQDRPCRAVAGACPSWEVVVVVVEEDHM